MMDDGSEKAFERARRPTWLLDDIHDMMLERNGKILFSEIPSLDSPTRLNHPDKSYLYKNYLREKAPNFRSNEIYQMKLKRTRIDIINASESQKKISNFVEKLREERRKQRKHQDAFMRQALDKSLIKSSNFDAIVYARPISAGNRNDQSPTKSLRNRRPQTAPSHSPTKELPSEKRYEKNFTPKGKNPLLTEINYFPPSSNPIEIQKKVLQKCLTLVKILEYMNNCKRLRLYYQAEMKGKEKFVVKIQRVYRQVILRRQAYHQAVMPTIFMRYLRNFQKKSAAKKIITFLREFSSIHSHVIVRRFMVCVRKSQLFIREMLAVKRARVQLITLYWERVERNYRKLIEDQERETFARLQRERMARMTAGSSSDIHGKWGMTHKQVVALFSHMDTIEMQRANILRDNHSSRSSKLHLNALHTSIGTPTSSVLCDTVDPLYRQKIIEKYVSYKRSLYLKKGVLKSPHHSRACSPRVSSEDGDDCQPFSDDALNLKLIKRFINETSPPDGNSYRGAADVVKISRELLERQLASAGVVVDDDGTGRKRKAAMRVLRKKPFLCLTDPSLGKPWKQIIEEVVREDIIRKKRVLQEQNRKTFQDRVDEEKKRGIPIPTFTSSNGRRGTSNTSQALFGLDNCSSAGHESPTSAPLIRALNVDDDALSTSSSPRSSHTSGASNHPQRSERKSHLSITSSSPDIRSHVHSPRFPSI